MERGTISDSVPITVSVNSQERAGIPFADMNELMVERGVISDGVSFGLAASGSRR